MSIHRITGSGIEPIERTTFDQTGLRERQDLQQLLKNRIEIIAPDTLIVAEEFGDWEDSRRRIDLLGIDKNANMAVIELKRTEDGGHMELQAIRYAAMISTLTFDKLVQTYSNFLTANNSDLDAQAHLLDFLDWAEPDEDQFSQEVKIILASAEFSKELTTSVMWLNDFGLDIRCVRMHPYKYNGEVLLDIQTVIPIPEVADYQVRIREKKQREREARSGSRDFSKFNIAVAGEEFKSMNKRKMMFQLVNGIIFSGGTPKEIQKIVDEKMAQKKRLFEVFDGYIDKEEIHELLLAEDSGGQLPRTKRFFCEEGEYFHVENKTYILTNQWGRISEGLAEALKEAFPVAAIEVQKVS